MAPSVESCPLPRKQRACLHLWQCWAVIAVAACHHAPPPAPPPAEKAIASIADVAGTWVRDDDIGWFYTLTSTPRASSCSTSSATSSAAASRRAR